MDLAIQLMAVVAVLGGLAFSVRLLQRRGLVPLKGNEVGLAIAGRIQLTPQHSLHLVKLGQRELLVAAHPSGLTVIESPAAGDGEGRR